MYFYYFFYALKWFRILNLLDWKGHVCVQPTGALGGGATNPYWSQGSNDHLCHPRCLGRLGKEKDLSCLVVIDISDRQFFEAYVCQEQQLNTYNCWQSLQVSLPGWAHSHNYTVSRIRSNEFDPRETNSEFVSFPESMATPKFACMSACALTAPVAMVFTAIVALEILLWPLLYWLAFLVIAAFTVAVGLAGVLCTFCNLCRSQRTKKPSLKNSCFASTTHLEHTTARSAHPCLTKTNLVCTITWRPAYWSQVKSL